MYFGIQNKNSKLKGKIGILEYIWEVQEESTYSENTNLVAS